MKIIGLIGGMSWESTAEYYRLINREVARRLGGLHSAAMSIYSFDFAEIEPLQRSGDWDRLGGMLASAGVSLRNAGAGLLLICSNTMHSLYERVVHETGLPVIHIADAAGRAIRDNGSLTVGLIGTRYTMESSFYTGRLKRLFGITTLLPPPAAQDRVNTIIFEELCKGIIRDESRTEIDRIIQGLCERGAQGVILGCTEIPLLTKEATCGIPLYDTTSLHALAAVDAALA